MVLIGPLSSEKSMSLLPKAWKEKLELLAGGVKDEAAVSMALRQANIRDKVIQTGKLPFERLVSVLSLADIFAMPNIKMHGDMEGFGLVALEASLRGALVLASAIDGIPDAIQDGKNGYLLPSADASTWISTLKALLSEQATLKQQAAKFTQFTLSNYSWEKMGQGYIDVFAEVIAGTKTKV